MSDKRKSLICYCAYHYENGHIRFVVESKNYDPSFKVGCDVHIDRCLELGKIVKFERQEDFIHLVIVPFRSDYSLHSPGSKVIHVGETLLLVGTQAEEADEPQPKQLRYVYFVSYCIPQENKFGRCEYQTNNIIDSIQYVSVIERNIFSPNGKQPIILNFQLLRTEEI